MVGGWVLFHDDVFLCVWGRVRIRPWQVWVVVVVVVAEVVVGGGVECDLTRSGRASWRV